MGHCVATLDPWTIIVAGGFSPNTNDYLDKAFIFNTKTGNSWISKPWSTFNYGPVMDSSCSLMHWQGKQQMIISGTISKI